MKSHRGTLILVFGILRIVLCGPLAIAAWVMGNGDLKEMSTGPMDPSGRDNTNAGSICEIIGTVLLILNALATLFFLGIFGLGFLGARMNQHH